MLLTSLRKKNKGKNWKNKTKKTYIDWKKQGAKTKKRERKNWRTAIVG